MCVILTFQSDFRRLVLRLLISRADFLGLVNFLFSRKKSSLNSLKKAWDFAQDTRI